MEVRDLSADLAKAFRPTRRAVIALRKPAEMAWGEFEALLRRIIGACEAAGDWWDVSTLIQPKSGGPFPDLAPGTYVLVSEFDPRHFAREVSFDA